LSENHKHDVETYIEHVLSGKIPCCKYVQLAVKRYVDDLENGHKRGIYFSEECANHVLDFYGFLRHSKGEWAGQVFELEAWQKFTLWNIYGWLNDEGNRRFRIMYEEVARKNGKSTKLAGVGLYMFIGDGEPGAEIYTAATKRDQAIITHSESKRMVQASSYLRSRIHITKNNLSITNTASKYEPLGADEDTLDGLNVHAAIIDELHAHKTSGVWDVLETAIGSRRQPLIAAITTAGFDKNTVCWTQHSYAVDVLEGRVQDDTYFAIIFTLDKNDDWQDEKNWIKANPNIGISVKLDDMRMQCKRAVAIPTQQNSFLRKRLNVWTEAETKWFTEIQWNACNYPVNIEGLNGRVCYGGLDLSSTKDITAFVLVFPPISEHDKYKVVCHFWLPQESILKRVQKDKVPYDVWIREGFIETTPGNIINHDYVFAAIDEAMSRFELRELAFDRWGSAQIVRSLQDRATRGDDSFLIMFGQGYASMSAPSKALETMILNKEMAHGGNPVLAWMAGNVTISQDAAGNYKPDKSKSREKIDGMVALIMALDRALKNKEEVSVYEDRGLLYL